MKKLPFVVPGYPKITAVTIAKQKEEAMAYVQTILPSILKQTPAEVLLPIEAFPNFVIKEFWNNDWPVLVNSKILTEDFVPITVIGETANQAYCREFMNIVVELLVSTSFKIIPIEVDYGRAVGGLEQNVVYDSLTFELLHKKCQPQEGFKFLLTEAKYPENWIACTKCYEAFDFTLLAGDCYFGPCNDEHRWRNHEERKDLYLQFVHQRNTSVTMRCPHCEKVFNCHKSSHIKTLAEYENFYP